MKALFKRLQVCLCFCFDSECEGAIAVDKITVYDTYLLAFPDKVDRYSLPRYNRHDIVKIMFWQQEASCFFFRFTTAFPFRQSQ